MKYILAYNYVGSMYGITIIVGNADMVLNAITDKLVDCDNVYSFDDLNSWISEDGITYNSDVEWQTSRIIFTITDMSGNVVVQFV